MPFHMALHPTQTLLMYLGIFNFILSTYPVFPICRFSHEYSEKRKTSTKYAHTHKVLSSPLGKTYLVCVHRMWLRILQLPRLLLPLLIVFSFCSFSGRWTRCLCNRKATVHHECTPYKSYSDFWPVKDQLSR